MKRKYRFELSDREFNLLEVLDAEIMNPSWDFSRIGGCGSFQFDLPKQFCTEKYIGGSFNIKIKKKNESTGNFDLRYQGLIESKAPSVKFDNEYIQVRGHGYQAQLKNIYVDEDYTSTEISVIVKDILDTYITPNTDITYDVGDIEATSFTPNNLSFNTDALSAIQTLADITGSREWGVDQDRKFYFKERSSDVGFYFPIAGKVTSFITDDSFKDIINRVIIQGGDVAGTPFTTSPSGSAYNDLASQAKFGRRDRVVVNSAITTDAVAQQFASAILAEYRDVIRRASCQILDDLFIEETIPIPLFQLIARGTTYGEKTYGTILYTGRINYQINRVNYRIDDNENMSINLDLGQFRPSIAENIKRLEYEIEQLRTVSL